MISNEHHHQGQLLDQDLHQFHDRTQNQEHSMFPIYPSHRHRRPKNKFAIAEIANLIYLKIPGVCFPIVTHPGTGKAAEKNFRLFERSDPEKYKIG